LAGEVFFTSAGIGVGSYLLWAAVAFDPEKFENASMSDCLSTRIAISSPSLTSFAPSGYNNYATYPSSCISKSTTALSVSIPQRTSPGLTLSPTFLFQDLMFPYEVISVRYMECVFVVLAYFLHSR